MKIHLEISARQTGKTARLIKAAIDSKYEGYSPIIVSLNSGMVNTISSQIRAYCITISQLKTPKVLDTIDKTHNPRFFFDEFDWMDDYPIVDNGYYVTTPSFIRRGRFGVWDKLGVLLSLVDNYHSMQLNRKLAESASITGMGENETTGTYFKRAPMD